MPYPGSAAGAPCPSGHGWLRTALLALAFVLLSGPAHAVQFGFDCITFNDPNGVDCGIGEAQLVMDVTDASDPNGAGVLFTFSNLGPENSTIRGVYFDDGTLLGISSIINDPNDVVFFADPNLGPGDLPGGNLASPPFMVTIGFLALSEAPPSMTGVDPNESVGIQFALMPGGTFADVLQELSDGTLRAGLHVVNFDSGGSESLVNIPEPGTLVLLATGLTALALLRRRRKPL